MISFLIALLICFFGIRACLQNADVSSKNLIAILVSLGLNTIFILIEKIIDLIMRLAG